MSVLRAVGAVFAVVALLTGSVVPVAAQEPSTSEPEPGSGALAQADPAQAREPVLGESLMLAGEWIAPGVASLSWQAVAGATAYELMYRSAEGWVLLSGYEQPGGVVAEFDGASAVVSGLAANAAEWWFTVRARSTLGVSRWSQATAVGAPEGDGAGPLFDPFTEPTLSGIDLERLREAVATVTPGEADCADAPELEVAGVTVVHAPADLGDDDAELTVAEVVRVAGGCMLVEYVALAGRSVAQVRALLADERTVHAVGEPIRGLVLDHEPPETRAHAAHSGGHHNDSGRTHNKDEGMWSEQWHLPQPTMENLWDRWDDQTPVTVAVLDSGVDISHPDFTENEGGSTDDDTHARIVNPRGCHAQDNQGHGTQMAGVIAAERGGGHVAGVAPEARILPLRLAHPAHGACAETAASLVPLTATAAVARATNEGARVINMSIRWEAEQQRTEVGGVPVGPSSVGADTFELALRAASMLGVVAVASAGNCGSDHPDDNGVPHWQRTKEQGGAGCPAHNAAQRPAMYPDTIAVANVNYAGQRDAASSANEHVNIAAPGTEIYTTRRSCSTAHCVARSDGTSPAAAFVSGAVALMVNRHPSATVGQVRRALEESAIVPSGSVTPRGREGDVRISPTPSAEYGRGIVDPTAAVERLSAEIAALRPSGSRGWLTAVSAGARHVCGVHQNGSVTCWGDPVVVAGVPDVRFESLWSAPTARYACGVRVDQVAHCWGEVPSQLTSPVAVPTATAALAGGFIELGVGDRHVCGLRPDGGVVCWGDNGSQQTSVPAKLRGFGEASSVGVTKVVSGSTHTCALSITDDVVCWGDNDDDRTTVPSALKADDIAAGVSHTCAVDTAGQVRCWGNNTKGQTTAPAGLFISIDAGADHTCGLVAADQASGLPAGALTCWGDSTKQRLVVPGGSFSRVTAGGAHSCAMTAALRVRCWGDNQYGQVPDGAKLGSLTLTVNGTELLAGRFDPAVYSYTISTDPSRATLRAAVNATDGSHSRIIATNRGVTSFPLSQSRTVSLTNGAQFDVRVGAIFGQGDRRTYRIRIAVPPRAGVAAADSLAGTGPQCTPQCPALECWIPPFDPDVTVYRTVAAADVAELAVEYRSTQRHGHGCTPADCEPC